MHTAAELAADAKDNPNLKGRRNLLREALEPENYVAGDAVDHKKLFKKDFDLIKQLNLNSFRFSIEWSRLEPHEGRWDLEGFKYYKEYLKELKSRNITTIVTLWHWTVPQWFEDAGGFSKVGNLRHFIAFVDRVVRLLGQDIDYIIVLNEPNVYIDQTFRYGTWPPGTKSKLKAFNTSRRLAHAHNMAYKRIKKIDSTILVSSSQNIAAYEAVDNRPITKISTRFFRYKDAEWFIHRTKKHMDFIGFNYYFHEKINGRKTDNNDKELSDIGWGMHPREIGMVIDRLHKVFKKPIMITENGLADEHDKYRKWWISETMIAMAKAIKDGVDLIGYMHWSLLDNFEWSYGFWPKFGLIAVDRNNMQRTIRPSAKWWAGVLKKLEPKPLVLPKEESLTDKVEAAFLALGYNKDAKSFRLHKK